MCSSKARFLQIMDLPMNNYEECLKPYKIEYMFLSLVHLYVFLESGSKFY